MDMVNQPEIPQYIMERLTDVYVENTRRVLELAGDRLDMVYFYDDVATQQNLMISARMWRRVIKPLHQRIIDVAKAYGKPVMYHCDGALYPLIPELIEMGVDVLNPVQADAAGMDPQRLKDEFGDRLSFHGGIDIIKTLPRGTRGRCEGRSRRTHARAGQERRLHPGQFAPHPVRHAAGKRVCHVRSGRPHTVDGRDGERQWLTATKSPDSHLDTGLDALLDALYDAVLDGNRPVAVRNWSS